MLNPLSSAKLSKTAISAMNSTALEFSSDVIERTDPILIDIFTRIENGDTTHEEEIEKLFSNYRKYGTVHV